MAIKGYGLIQPIKFDQEYTEHIFPNQEAANKKGDSSLANIKNTVILAEKRVYRGGIRDQIVDLFQQPELFEDPGGKTPVIFNVGIPNWLLKIIAKCRV